MQFGDTINTTYNMIETTLNVDMFVLVTFLAQTEPSELETIDQSEAFTFNMVAPRELSYLV